MARARDLVLLAGDKCFVSQADDGKEQGPFPFVEALKLGELGTQVFHVLDSERDFRHGRLPLR
jgi:hypothetical protein